MVRFRFKIFILFITTFYNSGAQVWESLADGIATTPTATTTSGQLLATAHILQTNDSQRLHAIRIWNGQYWRNLPQISTNNTGIITSLKFFNNDLYIAGLFQNINNLDSTHNIVKWNKSGYIPIPKLYRSLSSFTLVRGMEEYDNKLIIYGPFEDSTATNGMSITFFDGTNLSAAPTKFGSGLDGNILSMVNTISGELVLGGRFSKANGSSTKQLAIFSSVTGWSYVTSNPVIPEKVVAIKNNIYFYGKDEKGSTYGFYALKDGTIDSLFTNLIGIDKVYDIAVVNGELFASGIFYLSDDNKEYRLIKWGLNGWEHVINGNLLGVTNLTNYNEFLVASGFFTIFSGLPLSHIGIYRSSAGIARGQVFFDKDRNCIFDKRDEQLNNMAVRITPGNVFVKPNDNGVFFSVLPAGTYSFEVIPIKNWAVNTDCSNAKINTTITGGSIVDTINFAMLQDIGKRDLSIKLASYSGKIATNKAINNYILSYSNIGSTDISVTEVVLKYDSKLINLKAFPAPDKVIGDSAFWSVKNIYAGELRKILCQFEIDTDASEDIELEAIIGLQDDEEDKSDNKSKLTQFLENGAYQFKKYVLPSSSGSDTAFIGSNQKKIGYQVSFRNFTSHTIKTVNVIDTIKINHSMSYIQEVSSSHPYTTSVYPGLPGSDIGILVYTFENINLSPNPNGDLDASTNSGYISFEIGLSGGLANGVTLTNKAYVAFDYFEEEETNTVYAIVDSSILSAKPIKAQAFSVYPNPSRYKLNIPLIQNEKIRYKITSSSGMLMLAGKLDSQELDISSLSEGIYYIQLTNEYHVFNSKFIKLD